MAVVDLSPKERKRLAQELDAKLTHDKRRHLGVSDRYGRKSWDRARNTEVGDMDRLSPAQQSAIARRRAAEEAAVLAFQAEMKAKVAAEHPGRQSPRTRMKVLTDQLVAECDRTTKLYGYPVLPPSMTQNIVSESWKLGEPITRQQIEEYTKRTLERVARDHAKVYGHRNEGVSVVGGQIV